VKALKNLIKSGHIHVALALGASIIVLAYVSKRALPTPMKPIYLGVTSLIMVAYEAVAGTKKDHVLSRSIYWVSAIVLATAIIILTHLYR
jgi:hypothetical protein